MADPTESSKPSRASHAPPPIREDCWSEDATSTLVDAWGRRFVDLNRGNLRQKDWKDVAEAVNSRHAHLKKARRTDVQCKNRIDTLKKKYKLEKSRGSDSTWPFFSRLDALIGPTKKPSPSSAVSLAVPLTTYRKTPSTPVASLPQKRRSPSVPVDDSYFRQNYSTLAAAAAAADADSEGEEDEDESEGYKSSGEEREAGGIRRLAQAIASFGEIYGRVEAEKQRQMIELEKQRMQFVKDLEYQRMQMFMNTQVQLQKLKSSKRSESNDMYS